MEARECQKISSNLDQNQTLIFQCSNRLGWQPITPVQNLTRLISSTFSENSGREVSHGPILDIFFFEQISRNERFMAKVDF